MAVELPEQSRLFVVSGPSGVGKTVICDRLVNEYQCGRAITATTRVPRDGEVDGVDYYFYERERFLADVAEERFLEHAEVYGNLYGTPVGPLAARLQRGEVVLLNIDVQGASNLMDDGVLAQFVFLNPPSLEELERRLRSRGTDDPEAVQVRLATAEAEMSGRDRYHHQVVNDNLNTVVEDLAVLMELTARERPGKVEGAH